MNQAITTKYLGPTNFRPARVIARAAGGRSTLSWDYALDQDENHAKAARNLAEILGWSGYWYGGGLPDGCTNCYVSGPVPDEASFKTERA